MSLEEDLSKLFNSHLKILEALVEDLKDNPTTYSGDGSTLEFFWIKICLAVQSISKDSTNMCMMFSGPPLATKEECQPVLSKLERVAVALVSAFYSLPLTCGLTLKKQVHCAVVDIVKAVHCLSRTIPEHNFNPSKEQLQKTGSVWEQCDSFPGLPRDNVSAVLRDVKQCQTLVCDALREIEDAQNEAENINDIDDGFGDFSDLTDVPAWSVDDNPLVAPTLGLVKATKATLKKIAGVIRNQHSSGDDHHGAALDELNERLRGVSPAVDDVILCLYPPIDHTSLRQNVIDLTVLLESILGFIRESPLTGDTDETWLNFLTQAVHHNRDKLYQLIPGD